MILDDNKLTGTLPTELGKLKKLKSLELDTNQFTGSVPLEVCSLKENELLETLAVECDEVMCTCDCDCK